MEPYRAEIVWDDEDDLDGNVVHIAEHGLTREEIESVLENPGNETRLSRSSGLPITRGETFTGRWIAVVWEPICEDPFLIRPVTAFEPGPRYGGV